MPSRRAVLASGAVGAGALALAACGAAGSSGGGSRTPDRTASHTASDSGAGTALATLKDITVGRAVSVTLPDGSPALVARPSSDTVACFSAICTHMGCTVKPDGATLHCPCHGSMFDPATGKVTHGPAKKPLPAIPVHLVGGKVLSGG